MVRDVSALHPSSERVFWATRTVLVALTGVGTGAIAHVLMGGRPPGLLALLPAFVFSTLLALAFTKRASPLRLGVAAALSQTVFHALFVLGEGTSHLAHSPLAHSGLAHTQPENASGGVPLVVDAATAMTLAHAVAAIVTASSVAALALTLRLLDEVREVLRHWSRVVDLQPGAPQSGTVLAGCAERTWHLDVRWSTAPSRGPPATFG